VLDKGALSTKPKTKGVEATATHSLDRGLGQPCHQLLDVADTLSTSNRRPKPGTVPKLQVKPMEERCELPGTAAVAHARREAYE